MPLGTLDRSPPPFFRQGPSALSKLVFFGVLAVLLMVADNRFRIIKPVRAAIATVLYPLQWSMLQPVILVRDGGKYFESLGTSHANEAAAQYRLGLQSQRAQQVEQLTFENARLRALLDLRARVSAPALAAQVLYAAADPFTRKVIVDKGALAAVQPGSPVLDELGVLGQVTRVYPLVSEVTLITDRNQAIPVLNTRTGLRALAFGEPSVGTGSLELRFLDANVDLQAGDLMTTSGIDGVYPPGLQVARVSKIERGADSAFARVRCEPVADVNGGLHVLILQPQAGQVPARPEPAEDASVTKTKKAKP
ncbi:rod shape-determining protein MreC [Rhodoferax sp.]|uniref:rod shape-determining protein MreC n=1 Tax=Rhodoferax sp. TaxID=50421 RepID=UPI0028481D93|nr:rod shape-determining protein MreC [Rhodoferax sp.]MDR3371628.1 rod shape-determining protein MreC [Rhodoferax sp.]